MANNGGLRSTTAEEGQESDRRLLLVQKQIFRNPKCTVGANDGQSNHECRDEQRPNARQKHNNNGEHSHDPENLPVAVGPVEQDQGLRPKEIKEDPAPQEGNEKEQRYGMRDEAEGQDPAEQQQVIDAEICPVLADPTARLRQRLRLCQGAPIHHFKPWPPQREGIAGAIRDPGEEGSGRGCGGHGLCC